MAANVYFSKINRRRRNFLSHCVINMASSVRTFVRSLSRKNACFTAVLRWSECRGFTGAAEDRSTHFGFETVSEAEKASKGDFNVFVSNFKRKVSHFTTFGPILPPPSAGDIAFRFLDYIRSQQEKQQRRAMSLGQTPSWRDISAGYPAGGGAPESAVVVCDINKEMLKVSRQRADSRGVTTGDLLKHETLCAQHCILGEVIAGDWKSYQYLVESIRKFPDQEEFKGLMEDAGFFCVQYFNLTGGVVALHSGFKL
uniref:Uncharacterized protein n=1 Tax=Oryzias latipes TaxID=8090 RepID=A0A3P9M127_ORYLA